MRPLTEVYKSIEEKLVREKAAVKREEWLARLRRKAYISMVR